MIDTGRTEIPILIEVYARSKSFQNPLIDSRLLVAAEFRIRSASICSSWALCNLEEFSAQLAVQVQVQVQVQVLSADNLKAQTVASAGLPDCSRTSIGLDQA